MKSISILFLFSIFTIVVSTRSTVSIGDYLYLQFKPVFQGTLDELNVLVYHLAQQLFDRVPINAAGRTPIFPTSPAPWVSDFFGGLNGIAIEWNQHLTDFFGNIHTTIEPKTHRSLINVSSIEQKINVALKNLLVKLEDFFVDQIQILILTLLMKYQTNSIGEILPEFNRLLKNFRFDVRLIFDQREKQLFKTFDEIIGTAENVWNDFKDQIVG